MSVEEFVKWASALQTWNLQFHISVSISWFLCSTVTAAVATTSTTITTTTTTKHNDDATVATPARFKASCEAVCQPQLVFMVHHFSSLQQKDSVEIIDCNRWAASFQNDKSHSFSRSQQSHRWRCHFGKTFVLRCDQFITSTIICYQVVCECKAGLPVEAFSCHPRPL